MCCELIIGQNLLAHLKQSSQHSKDDIWLLNCLFRHRITSSRKRDLYVRTAIKTIKLGLSQISLKERSLFGLGKFD